MKIITPLLMISLVLFACKKKEIQADKDENAIVEYIATNGLNATATGSGLYYVIDAQGTGVSCNSNSTVKVAYTGYYLNGSIFDESSASGATFNLQGVIEGWTEGIPYFKKGGTGKLLVPNIKTYVQIESLIVPYYSIL